MCACQSMCECGCFCVEDNYYYGDVLATGLIVDVVAVISSLHHRTTRYVIDHGDR